MKTFTIVILFLVLTLFVVSVQVIINNTSKGITDDYFEKANDSRYLNISGSNTPINDSEHLIPSGYNITNFVFPKIIDCYDIYWEWMNRNETSICKCTELTHNFKNCTNHVSIKFCSDDWDELEKDTFFYGALYPFLKYNCTTGERLE